MAVAIRLLPYRGASPVVAVAARGEWAALPDSMSVDDVEGVTELVERDSFSAFEREHYCEDPYWIARRLRRDPNALDHLVCLADLLIALVACVRGWSGLDERPRDGDDAHEEAVALLRAIARRFSAGDTSVTLLADVRSEELEVALATPILDFLFEARLQNLCDRHRVETLRDLVLLDPTALLAETNLGRGSIAVAEAAISRALRMSWRNARHRLLPPSVDDSTPAPLPPRRSRWARLRATLPPRLLARTPAEARLPSRVIHFASTRRIATVRELLELSLVELAEGDHLGAVTLEELQATLERSLELESAPRVDPFDAHDDWISWFRERLDALDGVHRVVLERRAGVHGPRESLLHVGRRIARSRERVRQLESAAVADLRADSYGLADIAARLAGLVGTPFVHVTEIGGRDSFFHVDLEGEMLPCFQYVVERILASGLHVVLCDEGAFVTPLPPALFEQHLADLRATARALRYPVLSRDRDLHLAAALGWEPLVASAFASLVEQEWSREGDQLTAFGRASRIERVEALLRGRGEPVATHELEARFGRGAGWSELFFVGRGVVTLPELVPDFEGKRSRVASICKDIIERHDPERQWTTDELVSLVRLEVECDDWLNPWALGSLLRGATGIAYLGRNVVALPAAGQDRLRMTEMAVALLEDADGPLHIADLAARLRTVRGFRDGGWLDALRGRPLILLGGDRVGLAPRDVPGGAPEIARFGDALSARLWAHERGLTWREVALDLSRRGGPSALWSVELAYSVASQDGRFRCFRRSGVGLLEWESARVPSHADVLGLLLERHEGRITIDLAIRALSRDGVPPPSRRAVVDAAHEVGARVRGDIITSDAT